MSVKLGVISKRELLAAKIFEIKYGGLIAGFKKGIVIAFEGLVLVSLVSVVLLLMALLLVQ